MTKEISKEQEALEAKIPELTIDSTHRSFTIGSIKRAATRISALILGLTITISVHSGLITKASAEELPPTGLNYTDEDSTVVEVPERIRSLICTTVGKKREDNVTVRDLKTIVSFDVPLDNSVDSLEFLKYCTNLKSILFLALDLKSFDVLKTLPSFAQNIESLSVMATSNHLELNRELLDYILECTKTSELELSDVILTPGSEEALNNFKKLKLSIHNVGCDLDFTKLNTLKELDLTSTKPYTMAMFLNRKEYNCLIESGVNVKFLDDNAKKAYLSALDDLDQIVASINVSNKSSEKDVVNAVLTYVCERLTYSEKVKSGEKDEDFYENGLLDAVFNKPEQICGNYAALVEAIMDRIRPPEDSTLIRSKNHAWNIIIIDGEPYYVDATWLDDEYVVIRETENDGTSQKFHRMDFVEASKTGYDLDEFHWNQMPIDSDELRENEQKEAHNASFDVSYMCPRNEQKSSKKYSLKIGNKEIIIAGSVLVALLTAAGVLIAVKKKKEKEKIRRLHNRYQNSYWQTNPYDSMFSESDSSFSQSRSYNYRHH